MRKFYLILVLIVSATALVSAQGFQSTGSELMNTGSNYSAPVYGVGATAVDPVYGSASGPIKRGVTNNDDDPWGEGAEQGQDEHDTGFPIGAPHIMLLFAAAAGAVVALRRRKTKSIEN